MSSGRLPSLNDSTPGKGALKFKPRAVARRSKEERDASAPKVKKEGESKGDHKKARKPLQGNQKKRVPRYLSSTHVISTGPLAAGNFVDDSKGNVRRGIVKVEGGDRSLVKKGLQSIENHTGESDDELGLDEKTGFGEINEFHENDAQSKFNMGREFTSSNYQQDNSDIEDEDADMEEDAVQRRRIEELFPVRPLRIRHEDIEVIEHKIEDSMTELTTPESTPDVYKIKPEETGTLNDVLANQEAVVQSKLEQLNIAPELQSIDEVERKLEQAMLVKDHKSIIRKLNKMNDKHDRFMIFQLPYKLPTFDEVVTKKENIEPSVDAEEKVEDNGISTETPVETKVEEDKKKAKGKSKTKSKKHDKEHIPQGELVGNIGSIRVHKSGKLSIKIGNIVMDVSKGSETAFLQDVIALNEDVEVPGVELLGRVEGKAVVTPRF